MKFVGKDFLLLISLLQICTILGTNKICNLFQDNIKRNTFNINMSGIIILSLITFTLGWLLNF